MVSTLIISTGLRFRQRCLLNIVSRERRDPATCRSMRRMCVCGTYDKVLPSFVAMDGLSGIPPSCANFNSSRTTMPERMRSTSAS